MELGRGDYFGERALLKDDPRAVLLTSPRRRGMCDAVRAADAAGLRANPSPSPNPNRNPNRGPNDAAGLRANPNPSPNPSPNPNRGPNDAAACPLTLTLTLALTLTPNPAPGLHASPRAAAVPNGERAHEAHLARGAAAELLTLSLALALILTLALALTLSLALPLPLPLTLPLALPLPLTKVPLLSHLTEAERDGVITQFREVKYAPTEFIIRQGETGDQFFIVKEGEVECHPNPNLNPNPNFNPNPYPNPN
eukprot:scaffold47773_cov48-Phaeocystis_antarctica.AAC.2